ncbi:RNA-binding protein 39-like isoform X1 [Myxocyprinus asiaticus]|uniref:RNA-binding protein 39-like isoform X1 n=2 Tax=Myxocyprinus asiaticus TaxID=70543 RepID=UPI0022215701|nr:RNA-binding protein 39-like isoform X1 [Myxocyprinus asiaticus]
MADDFDVEAMLEAPYKKGESKSFGANSHDDSRSKKKRHSKSRSPDHRRSRSRDRKKSREQRRSRSRDRRPSRSKERRRSRSRSRNRGGRYRGRKSPFMGPKLNGGPGGKFGPQHFTKHSRRRSRSKSPFKKDKSPFKKDKSPFKKDKSPFKKDKSSFKKDKSPIRQPIDNLSPEERDARTVFCMQLAARIRPKDLEEFFSAVGKVRDVRMISDRNSRRSKGIAYIEFVEATSVPLAIGLTGQRVLGVPIIVQASQAEKNRAAAALAASLQRGGAGPMRLYVGSLHFNITEDMLRGIFEPFGKIEGIQLMMDNETGRSKGYGFISFADAECAKKALDQLNGFELAGRPMKVGHVTERSDASSASSFLDNDELERTGIDLGTTGRLQLMARLAEGTGLQIPAAAKHALQMSGSLALGNLANATTTATAPLLSNPGMNQAMNLPTQPLATHCLQLSNMFNPQSEDEQGWDIEIQDDVIEECKKHGGIVHIYIDKNSPQGNVYVKCQTIPVAMAVVGALHGRWFAGKMITAAYVPLPTYHNLFPDSATATELLRPTRR